MAFKKIFGKSDASPTQLVGDSIADTSHISAINSGGCAIATIKTERVSDYESQALTNELLEAASKANHKLVVDMSHVTMLASAGIGMLVQLHKECSGQGGGLALASLDKDIHEMLKLTRMDKLLTIADSPSAAKSKLS